MNFLNRCNGIVSPRPRLSEAAFKVFCEHKEKARADFRSLSNIDGGGPRNPFTYEGVDYYLCLRFLDDNSVLERIESGLAGGPFEGRPLTEADFLADPYAWCLDALRDCAKADHWYAFEKDWG